MAVAFSTIQIDVEKRKKIHINFIQTGSYDFIESSVKKIFQVYDDRF